MSRKEIGKLLEDQAKAIAGLRCTRDLQAAVIVKLSAERDTLRARCEQLKQEQMAMKRSMVPGLN